MSSEEIPKHTYTLKHFIIFIVMCIIISNSIILFSDSHNRHFISLLILNITAITASILGIVTICRYGISGVHGVSYMLLTLGIIACFFADFIVLYNYQILNIQDLELVSITDLLWFVGYGFLALHLFVVLGSLHIKIKSTVFIGIFITTAFFYWV